MRLAVESLRPEFRSSIEFEHLSLFENCIGKLRLVSVKELSVTLNRPEKTIRDWILKDKIPFVRENGRIQFNPVSIARWLAEGSSV